MGAKANLILVVLFLFSVAASAAFDYYQLVLQNQVNVCSSVGKKCQRTPKQEFTLHGLWPANYTGPWLLSCSSTKFDRLLVSSQQAIRLDTYWPDLLNSQSNIGFWSCEWLRHCTCSETMYKQVAYFDFALDAAVDVRNLLTSHSIVGSGQIFTTVNLQTLISQAIGAVPALKCLTKTNPIKGTVNSQLTEIIICLGPRAPLTYQNCNTNLSICKGQITFNCGYYCLVSSSYDYKTVNRSGIKADSCNHGRFYCS